MEVSVGDHEAIKGAGRLGTDLAYDTGGPSVVAERKVGCVQTEFCVAFSAPNLPICASEFKPWMSQTQYKIQRPELISCCSPTQPTTPT